MKKKQACSKAARTIDNGVAVCPKGDFFRSKSIERLAAEQGVKPIDRAESLRGDFWPEDENSDEFLSWLRNLRAEGRGQAGSRPRQRCTLVTHNPKDFAMIDGLTVITEAP